MLVEAQDINAIKNIRTGGQTVLKTLQQPLTLHHAEASYYWLNNGAGLYSDKLSYYGDFFLTSSWSIASVPLEVVVNNQTLLDMFSNNLTNASIRFDRDVYLDMLKNKMKKELRPDKLSGKDPVEWIKKTAQESLRNELEKINKLYNGELKPKLSELQNLDGIFTSDMASLRQQFLNGEYLKQIRTKENMVAELINKKNTGQPVDLEELAKLEKDIVNVKGVQALVSKIEEHKSKWQSSGLISAIQQSELLRKKQVDQLINDPNTVIRLVKEQFNLNSFQKLFLKINKLNIGQNAISTSKLSAQHLLNKGINTEFLNNNRYLMIGAGKLKNLNSILDQGFTNVLQSNDGLMKMASVGLGKTSGAHSHISVMTFDQSMGNIASLAMSPMRKSLVTTFSNELHIGAKGVLITEVSRSASSYANVTVSDSTLESKSAINRVLGTDDLLRNMAFSLKYDDEWEAHQLSYGIRVERTANGYTNPGSSFLNSGAKSVGFNLRKFLFNRSLQASLRSDMREFDYSDDNRKIWRNFYSVLNIKWKLRKGQSVGVRYMPNKMVRIDEQGKNTMSSMSRLSLDANISQKIGGLYYRNNISLSRQKNNYLLLNDRVSCASLVFASFQNIVIGQRLYYLNVNYDYVKNNSTYIYLNSSFVADAGTTYMLLKKISLSSAISFNSVEGWYSQVGIKQTISGQIGDRFNLNGYLDIRKNLKVYQQLFYGPVRADISLHYILKK